MESSTLLPELSIRLCSISATLRNGCIISVWRCTMMAQKRHVFPSGRGRFVRKQHFFRKGRRLRAEHAKWSALPARCSGGRNAAERFRSLLRVWRAFFRTGRSLSQQKGGARRRKIRAAPLRVLCFPARVGAKQEDMPCCPSFLRARPSIYSRTLKPIVSM